MQHRGLNATRSRLEHAVLALADQDDDDGTLLRHDARELLHVIGLVADTPGAATTDRVSDLLSRGQALIERVRAYADRAGVYLGSGTMSETQVLSSEDVLRMLAEMRPGATEPPPALLPALIEAAEGPEPRHDTVPAPADTAAELPEEDER
jgi:hypothetical protein